MCWHEKAFLTIDRLQYISSGKITFHLDQDPQMRAGQLLASQMPAERLDYLQ